MNNTTRTVLAFAAGVITTGMLGQTMGPVEPVPVGIAAHQDFNQHYVFRLWSDGSVDLSRTDGCGGALSCGPNPVIPGTCTADANRNGEVEINDLVTTLAEWGPCE